MRIRFSTRLSRDPAYQHAATMKRADIEPVTAPMAETNRAVVRASFHSAADISSATMSVLQTRGTRAHAGAVLARSLLAI